MLKPPITARYCKQQMPGCKGWISMTYIGGTPKAKKDYLKLTSCTNRACSTKAKQEGAQYKRKPQDIQVELSVMDLWLMRKIV